MKILIWGNFKKIEIAPNKAVLGLMLYKIEIPKTVNKMAMIIAKVTDILFVGRGLSLVLCIKASVSISIIWLNALDAPTIKKPPNANNTTAGGGSILIGQMPIQDPVLFRR